MLIPLEKEVVSIRGIDFTVTEIKHSDVWDLMASTEQENLTHEMCKVSITVKGKPIGDEFGELPMAVSTELIEVVTRLNNTGGEAGKS